MARIVFHRGPLWHVATWQDRGSTSLWVEKQSWWLGCGRWRDWHAGASLAPANAISRLGVSS